LAMGSSRLRLHFNRSLYSPDASRCPRPLSSRRRRPGR